MLEDLWEYIFWLELKRSEIALQLQFMGVGSVSEQGTKLANY